MLILGKIFRGIGWFMTVGFIMVFISEIGGDTEETSGSLTGMFFGYVFTGLFPLLSGYYMIKKTKQEKTNATNTNLDTSVNKSADTSAVDSDYEIKIIRLAQENDGFISRVDVVLLLNISSKKAQLVIDELYAGGVFDIQLTENGSTLYKLRNYCSSEERQTASSLYN